MADAPVQLIPGDAAKGGPVPGIGLCLSGGGYRAMMFHVGVLWRLYEAGVLEDSQSDLERLGRIDHGRLLGAEVEGAELRSGASCKHDFVPKVVAPVRATRRRDDRRRGRSSWDWSCPAASAIASPAPTTSIFRRKTLQDLPDQPRFVINATNVQSGVLWRFSSPTCATIGSAR